MHEDTHRIIGKSMALANVLDILYKTSSRLVPWDDLNCQIHLKQGTSKKQAQPRGAWGAMTTKCDGVSWMEFWNSKRTFR